MIEYMRERNAMKGGPGDPPNYTAKDSANYVKASKKLAKTKTKLEKLSSKKPKSTIGRAVNTYKTMAARTKMEKQQEAMDSNPYSKKVKTKK